MCSFTIYNHPTMYNMGHECVCSKGDIEEKNTYFNDQSHTLSSMQIAQRSILSVQISIIHSLRISHLPLLQKPSHQVLREAKFHIFVHFGPALQMISKRTPLPNNHLRRTLRYNRAVGSSAISLLEGNIVDKRPFVNVGGIRIMQIQFRIAPFHKVYIVGMDSLLGKSGPIWQTRLCSAERQ